MNEANDPAGSNHPAGPAGPARPARPAGPARPARPAGPNDPAGPNGPAGSYDVAEPYPLRQRLALALDVDDLVEATRLARDLQPWFSVAKVGLELFSAAGPEVVAALDGCGYRVFVDLKLHDIPTTVGRASRVLGGLGASYMTMHAEGGVPMLHAGVEGLADGAAAAGCPPPVALAVTVLTSAPIAASEVLEERVAAARAAGCGGVVCATGDVGLVKALDQHLFAVVPGIRPAGTRHHDQGRAATPQAALAAGADLLVVGRAVTAAPDPQAAACSLVESVISGVAGSAKESSGA